MQISRRDVGVQENGKVFWSRCRESEKCWGGAGTCWLRFAHRAPRLESPLGCLLLGDKKATVSGGGDRDADAGGGPYNETFI